MEIYDENDMKKIGEERKKEVKKPLIMKKKESEKWKENDEKW